MVKTVGNCERSFWVLGWDQNDLSMGALSGRLENGESAFETSVFSSASEAPGLTPAIGTFTWPLPIGKFTV